MRTVSFESYFDPDRHTGSLLKPGNGGDDAPDTVPPAPTPANDPNKLPPEEVDLDELDDDDAGEYDEDAYDEDGDDEFED